MTSGIQAKYLNMGDEPDMFRMEKAVSVFLENIKDMASSGTLSVEAKKSHKSGRKRHYEFHLHLSAPGIDLLSKSEGWSAAACVEEALGRLEKEIRKKFGKRRSEARAKARDARNK